LNRSIHLNNREIHHGARCPRTPLDWISKTTLAAIIIAEAKPPVEWVVVDASAINVVYATALMKLDELRAELSAQGISLFYARVKRSLEKYFNRGWAQKRRKLAQGNTVSRP
jgi:hypothetical protein